LVFFYYHFIYLFSLKYISFLSHFYVNICLIGKDTESGLTIGVKRANGPKCDRCWYYSDTVGADEEDIHKDVCARCANVVRSDGYVFDAPVPAAGALPLI
jgi:isoleucyl-tRNA synthetase